MKPYELPDAADVAQLRSVSQELAAQHVAYVNLILAKILTDAGPGHAVGYRIVDRPEHRFTENPGTFETTIEYETHLAKLQPDGSLVEGRAGFRYVRLPCSSA